MSGYIYILHELYVVPLYSLVTLQLAVLLHMSGIALTEHYNSKVLLGVTVKSISDSFYWFELFRKQTQTNDPYGAMI
jgi:hypothetical protein